MIGLALHLAARAIDAAREAVSVPRLRAALTRQHEELQRQWGAVSELQGALEREKRQGQALTNERDKARAELAELRCWGRAFLAEVEEGASTPAYRALARALAHGEAPRA